jgi:ribosome biogenesis GTPase
MFQKGEIRERAPVCVGDRVEVRVLGSKDGVVESRGPRRNQLARPAPGRDGQVVVHVVASNIDRLVIVASADEPKFSPGLVDRFLVAAQRASIPTTLCLTKIDLLQSQSAQQLAEIYVQLQVPVFGVCSKTGLGLEALLNHLQGQMCVFAGHSGVGKTTLLRSLLDREVGKVGEVSAITGKGKHTTSSAYLFQGPAGSRWVDTPGVREFGLVGCPPEELADAFPEFQTMECTPKGCSHYRERICVARHLPRYESYLRILASLLEERDSGSRRRR